MTNEIRRIYFDACIVIYLVERKEPYVISLRQKLQQAIQTDGIFVASDLTKLEGRILPIRYGNMLLLEEYDKFFAEHIDEWCNFSRPVFDLATQLRAEHGLKTPDALHLAAAIIHGCDEFWTNDLRLQKAAGQYLKVINILNSKE